eukprot:403335589
MDSPIACKKERGQPKNSNLELLAILIKHAKPKVLSMIKIQRTITDLKDDQQDSIPLFVPESHQKQAQISAHHSVSNHQIQNQKLRQVIIQQQEISGNQLEATDHKSGIQKVMSKLNKNLKVQQQLGQSNLMTPQQAVKEVSKTEDSFEAIRIEDQLFDIKINDIDPINFKKKNSNVKNKQAQQIYDDFKPKLNLPRFSLVSSNSKKQSIPNSSRFFQTPTQPTTSHSISQNYDSSKQGTTQNQKPRPRTSIGGQATNYSTNKSQGETQLTNQASSKQSTQNNSEQLSSMKKEVKGLDKIDLLGNLISLMNKYGQRKGKKSQKKEIKFNDKELMVNAFQIMTPFDLKDHSINPARTLQLSKNRALIKNRNLLRKQSNLDMSLFNLNDHRSPVQQKLSLTLDQLTLKTLQKYVETIKMSASPSTKKLEIGQPLTSIKFLYKI